MNRWDSPINGLVTPNFPEKILDYEQIQNNSNTVNQN
jgi:hypothetical protein